MRFSPDTRHESRTMERELLEHLDRSERAENLRALARLGAPGGNRNHLATVFVDGNAFGDFFDQLASHSGKLAPGVKTEISRSLNKDTRAALVEAGISVAVQEIDDTTLSMIPHLVGGDDVLVTLPADRAWLFVIAYLRHFGKSVMATRAQAAASVPELPHLSASAGVVFSHHSEPFHLVVEEATRCLATAKSLVRGQEASIATSDLTTGGSGAPVRLADVEAYADRLTALAELPASARQSLVGALRRNPDDPTVAENQALRLGHAKVTDPFLAAGAPIGLEHALHITRWWR
jgi:hypothetical protein